MRDVGAFAAEETMTTHAHKHMHITFTCTQTCTQQLHTTITCTKQLHAHKNTCTNTCTQHKHITQPHAQKHILSRAWLLGGRLQQIHSRKLRALIEQTLTLFLPCVCRCIQHHTAARCRGLRRRRCRTRTRRQCTKCLI